MGISNALLVSFIYVEMNPEAIRPLLNLLETRSAMVAADPLAAARLQRTNNELMLSLSQPVHKGALTMTRISLSGVSIVSESSFATNTAEISEQAEEVSAPFENNSDTADLPVASTEEVGGPKTEPILRKHRTTGQLEIGNFKPMSVTGRTGDCLNIGYSMLNDTGSSQDLLEVMMASDQITIARICANNGSIVLSCRNDQITVSPRRARPDDKCERAG
jgi:hypothetical protein